MFGYQVILEMDGNKYDIVDYDFAFVQAYDNIGQPQGEVYSGAISLTYPNLPTKEMLQWMLNTRKYTEGIITTYGEDGVPLQKLEFKQATCVNMKIDYKNIGATYCNCKLTIVANKIDLGGSAVDNDWSLFSK